MAALLLIALSVQPLCADPLETAPAQAAGAAEAAREVAAIATEYTAIAFCPVLGVAIVGGWTYWTTPESQRPLLPFFFQPWFVLGCAFLSMLYVGKGTVLQFAPVLKKPMDMLAVMTNGAGAVVLFIPMLFDFARRVRHGGAALEALGLPSLTVYAADGAAGQAAEPVSWFIVAIAVGFAAAAFWALWLLGNVANSFILANPIPFLDLFLMAAIGLVFVGLGLAAWMHPFVGLAASAVLVLIAFKLAGWAFRWSVFALVFSWDFLTFQDDRSWGVTSTLRAFSGAGLDLPKRTMGRVVIGADGSLSFRYRAMMAGPRRTLPIATSSLALGRTITHPCLVRREGEGSRYAIAARLPPRYRKQQDVLGKALGVPTCDIGIRGGIAAAWRWVRSGFPDWQAGETSASGAATP